VAISTRLDEFRDGVWRYLRVLGCGVAEADDLVQETFVTVLSRGFAVTSPATAWSRVIGRDEP